MSDITTVNPLLRNAYTLVSRRLPDLVVRGTRTNLPGVSVPSLDTSSTTLTVPSPGTKLVYEPLQVTVRVDEDMKVWVDLYKWLCSYLTADDRSEMVEDVTQIIQNNHLSQRLAIRYVDAFPVTVGSLDFDAMIDSGDDVHEFPVTFAYTTAVIDVHSTTDHGDALELPFAPGGSQ